MTTSSRARRNGLLGAVSGAVALAVGAVVLAVAGASAGSAHPVELPARESFAGRPGPDVQVVLVRPAGQPPGENPYVRVLTDAADFTADLCGTSAALTSRPGRPGATDHARGRAG